MASIAGVSTATRTVEDAFYVSVGAGVLALQSAQVRRRELRARLTDQLDDAHQAVDRVRTGADDSLRVVEHQLDEVLGHVEERLPDPARTLLLKGRSAGAEARQRVHGMLRPDPTDEDVD
jgi:hypothetical protein